MSQPMRSHRRTDVGLAPRRSTKSVRLYPSLILADSISRFNAAFTEYSERPIRLASAFRPQVPANSRNFDSSLAAQGCFLILAMPNADARLVIANRGNPVNL